MSLASDFSSPCEYVADIVNLEACIGDNNSLIRTRAEASEAIINFLEKRVLAVLEKYESRPLLMLSGGVDSILLATILAKHAPNTLAVTFIDPYEDRNSSEEFNIASEVAANLGLEHVVTELDSTEYESLVRETVIKLDCTDPWEVLAGVILLACEQEGRKHDATGAMFTGAGADALFLGGSNETITSNEEYQEKVLSKVRKNFIRGRQIPDFYERLLDDADRYIQVWQTIAGFELAMRIPVELSRGKDGSEDKALIRQTLVSLGADPEHAWTTKNPMQVSSGGINSLVALARVVLSNSGNHSTYTDPLDESLGFTAARLFLELTHISHD